MEEQFVRLSFLLVNGLKEGNEFGLDGRVWTVKRFNGVKLIKPGLHLFLFGSGDDSGLGIRYGLFRFFPSSDDGSASDTLTVDWQDETLVNVQTAVVSLEHKQSLDQTLAPCVGTEEWSRLVDFVRPPTLERVVGLDDYGCAIVDSFSSTPHELHGKGKAIAQSLDDVGSSRRTSEDHFKRLRFADFNVARSAPSDSTGAERSKWSYDKTRLMQSVVSNLGSPQELLAELQLSFLMFALVRNFAALETYKSIVRLVCESREALLPPSNLLPVFASFVDAFRIHMSFLPPEVFSTQLSGVEHELLGCLASLRVNLEEALPAYHDESNGTHPVWTKTIANWTQLSNATVERFGWEIGMVRGSRHRHPDVEGVAIEDLEEGEDAPVIMNKDML